MPGLGQGHQDTKIIELFVGIHRFMVHRSGLPFFYMKVWGPMPSSARSGNGRHNTFILRCGSKPWAFVKT